MKILLSFKKISKFIFSKVVYILIGIFIALSIYVVQASIPSKVSGDLLTAGDWNELVDVVNNLNTNVNNIDNSLNNLNNSVTILQASAFNDADVKSYLENNCYVCIGWGDWGQANWLQYKCKKFGEDWGAIYPTGTYGDDVFGIKSYCN